MVNGGILSETKRRHLVFIPFFPDHHFMGIAFLLTLINVEYFKIIPFNIRTPWWPEA